MSSVSIQGNASGTGIFTIASPNSNTNRTLTLPDSSGTLALAGSSLTGVTDSASPFETALGTGAGGSNTGVNNTFVGYNAGTASTTGTNNTAVGYQALDANTTGAKNTAVGEGALGANTTASDNVAIGYNAASSLLQPGYGNVTAVGHEAATSHTGYAITAIGNQALKSNTTGLNNVAVGHYDNYFGANSALQSNTTGGANHAFGSKALGANTTGSNNIAMGYGALGANSTADNNIAIGNNALGANTTGANNTAVGYAALDANTTATANTAMGSGAGGAITSGSQNTAMGEACLSACTTGATNTAVGVNAGGDITTGSNNLLLGLNSGRSTAPSGQITTGSNIVCLGNNSITDLYCADTTISSSDARDKTDVQDFTHGLDWITQLRPVTYKWDKRAWYVGDDATTEDVLNAKPDGSKKKNRLNIGFLAQEEIAVEQQFGYATSWETMLVAAENEDSSAYGLKYERLVPVLVNAIKELKAINDAQATRIETLEAQNAAFETRLAALENK